LAAEKRVLFRSAWLPWVLLAPQLVVITLFFFWPAGQALVQSLQQQDAFGTSVQWVGLENFQRLFADPSYYDSMKTTLVFSLLVAGIGLGVSLLLAVMADRIVRGSTVYKTLLIWPYAVAPAVAGVLWLFMFAPSIGVVAWYLRVWGFEWNHLLDGNHAMALIVMAAVWKQLSYNFLFFLAGLQSIPKSLIEAAAIDGARPWRRFWTIVFPLLSPQLLPAGGQRGLRLPRHLCHRRRQHPRRPGQGNRDPGLQAVLRRLQGHGPRRLGRAVGGADGDRGAADHRPVQVRGTAGQLLGSSTPHEPVQGHRSRGLEAA